MKKPREAKTVRSLSSCGAEMPGALASTSPRVVMFWSSIRWRVMTLTDCGVSRVDSGSPVAAAVAPVV